MGQQSTSAKQTDTHENLMEQFISTQMSSDVPTAEEPAVVETESDSLYKIPDALRVLNYDYYYFMSYKFILFSSCYLWCDIK